MFIKFRNTQKQKLPNNIKSKEMQKKHEKLVILNLLDSCTQIMKEDRINLRNLIKQNNQEVIDLLSKHLKNTDMHLLQTQIRKLLNKIKGKKFQAEPSIFAQINDFNKITKQPLTENIQQLNKMNQITQEKQLKKQIVQNYDQENQYQCLNNQKYQQNNIKQSTQGLIKNQQKEQLNYYNQDRIKELTIEDQEDFEVDQNQQSSNSKQNSSFQSNQNQLNKSVDYYQIQQNEFNYEQEINDNQSQQQQNQQDNQKQYSSSKSQQCIRNSSNKKPLYELNDFKISDYQNIEKNSNLRNINASIAEQYDILAQNTDNSQNTLKNYYDNQFSKYIKESKNQKPLQEIQSNFQSQDYYNDNAQYETSSEQINKFKNYQQQNNELNNKTCNNPYNLRQQIGKTESYKQLLSNNGLIQNKDQQQIFQPSTFQIYDFLLKTDTKTVYNSPRNNPKNQLDGVQDIMNLDWQDQQDNENFIYQNVKTVDSQQLYQKPIEETIQNTNNQEVEYLKKALFLENMYLEDIFDEIFIDYKLSKISKVFFRLKMDQAIKDLRNDNKLNINESDLNRFFEFCDTKHDNFLDINEFGPALRFFCKHKSENENLVYQVFEFLDFQKNGFISQNDLLFQLQQLNTLAKQNIKDYDDKNYSPQLISEKIFEEIDIKKKGILTYFDFYLQKNSYFYRKIEGLFENAKKKSKQ